MQSGKQFDTWNEAEIYALMKAETTGQVIKVMNREGRVITVCVPDGAQAFERLRRVMLQCRSGDRVKVLFV